MRLPETERVNTEIKLQRAVIIGLGGTGAEVLVRTRRMLIDTFGDLSRIPIVRFLYIDTDPQWWNEQTTKVERDVQLMPTEYIDAQVHDARSLLNNINSGHQPNWKWLSVEQINVHHITSGAGTIRQLGRLCFWFHYASIAERLRDVISNLIQSQHEDFMREQYDIDIQAGINIHVVAGLAGGTGSGMLLDLTYLVRKICHDLSLQDQSIEINGYLVLPQAFSDLAGANALANGYAVLKELNYYSYVPNPNAPLAPLFRVPRWDADYLQDQVNRVQFEGQPPFDHCYLLGLANPNNTAIQRPMLFGMVARALFHEFTLSFAAFKRSLRANIRNRIAANPRDAHGMPINFMSFGQSGIIVPHREVKELFAHQLALRAVQRWIDRQAEPIRLYEKGDEGSASSERLIASIQEQSQQANVVDDARAHVNRELLHQVGLRIEPILNEILRADEELLTGYPNRRVEDTKQQWTTERWDYRAFEGKVTDVGRALQDEFKDEGADPNQWGEQIRKLDVNRTRAYRTYRANIERQVYNLFEDAQRYGPAFALAVVRHLRAALGKLRQTFLDDANNPVRIANILGEVYLTQTAPQTTGTPLTTLIERKISDMLKELSDAVRSPFPFGKRERVERAAENYLSWCAWWCRARIEERARRLAARLASDLQSYMDELEASLLDRAAKLAELQGRILELALAWRDKARRLDSVGSTLSDAEILQALEAMIRDRQKELYDPDRVARNAIARLGISLQQISSEDIPKLVEALIEEAHAAVGELSERELANTQFAVYDLLSKKYANDNQLRQELERAFQKSAPYILLQPNTGLWNLNAHLLEIEGVGMYRGGQQVNDDPEHARLVRLLGEIGINPVNTIRDIGDSGQIVFFQECGGFPLRAIQGVRQMKQSYLQHLESAGQPLHIVRDELAVIYPDLDIVDKSKIERAEMARIAGLAFGIITKQQFRDPNTRRELEMYAYPRENPAVGTARMIRICETVEGITPTFLSNPSMLEEVVQIVQNHIKNAPTPEPLTQKLLEYLDAFQKRLTPIADAQGREVKDMPEYQREEDLVTKIIHEWIQSGG